MMPDSANTLAPRGEIQLEGLNSTVVTRCMSIKFSCFPLPQLGPPSFQTWRSSNKFFYYVLFLFLNCYANSWYIFVSLILYIMHLSISKYFLFAENPWIYFLVFNVIAFTETKSSLKNCILIFFNIILYWIECVCSLLMKE